MTLRCKGLRLVHVPFLSDAYSIKDHIRLPSLPKVAQTDLSIRIISLICVRDIPLVTAFGAFGTTLRSDRDS